MLEKVSKLAEKHKDLKNIIETMINDLDDIEREYNELIKKIKQ